ncbi:MAG: hypothetical protein RhofKO_01160 [Rhodothermales bacterium]
MPNQPIAQTLLEAQVALDNALTDPALITALAAFGYDADRLNEGKALYDAAATLQSAQQSEYGEQLSASAAFKEAHAAAREVYVRHLTLARLAFKQDAGALAGMKLTGRRKTSFSGWLEQAEQMYDGLLSKDAWKAAMASFGQDEASLQEGKRLLEVVAAANTVHQQEKGEAQKATQDRDKALDALAEWMSDFRTVARLALADDPQQLEKLGIVAR